MTQTKKEKHNLDTCTGDPCSCNPLPKTSWEEEFDKEYGHLQLNQWCVGFVTLVITEDRIKPRFGNGSDLSYLTEKLISFISKTLTSQREELIEEIQEKLEVGLKWGTVRDREEDNQWKIHYRGFREAVVHIQEIINKIK